MLKLNRLEYIQNYLLIFFVYLDIPNTCTDLSDLSILGKAPNYFSR